MTATTIGRCLAAVFAASLFGCETWLSDKIATGTARLSMGSVGAMVSLVSNDAKCGFASDRVLANPQIEGYAGGSGRVSWLVKDCVIDLRDDAEVSRDCQGNTTRASGKLTITALKTVTGRITGNAETPVLPGTTSDARIEIMSADFDHFRVSYSDLPNALNLVSGSLAATVTPRLATSAKSGLCSVPTPNVRFEHVAYAPSEAIVEMPDRVIHVSIDGSDLAAQSGQGEDSENSLAGTLSLWGSSETIPAAGDEDGLSPDYNRRAFAEAYACNEGMELPARFDCNAESRLGLVVSRLSMRTLATLLVAVNDDTRCGFASAAAALSSQSTGTLGDPGGTVTQTISECVLEFAAPKAVISDCAGVSVFAQGRAVISAQKILSGYLSGDPNEPVVPTNRDPARIIIDAQLDNWSVSISTADEVLTTRSGRIHGTAMPRTSLNTETGCCSIPTSILELRDVHHDNADVTLRIRGLRFDMHVDDSQLNATNGPKDGVENYIGGHITVGGHAYAMENSVLDPGYDAAVFHAGYACAPGYADVDSDAACSFTPTLAQGAARLAVKTLGLLAGAIDADTACGLKSPQNMLPIAMSNQVNGEVTGAWLSEQCSLGSREVMNTCDGRRGFLEGTATVTALKTATGKLSAGDPPLLPQTRRAVRFDLDQVTLHEVAMTEATPLGPAPYLVVHDGTLSGVVLPVTGEAADIRGAYFIGTPVAEYQAQSLAARATLHVGAKQFNITIDSTNLNAMSGTFAGVGNQIEGSISVNGQSFEVPLAPLDPTYDQAAFDASYACTPNLYAPVPAGQ